MAHRATALVLSFLLIAACSGEEEEPVVQPDPVMRTELDEGSKEWLRKRMATAEEQLLSSLDRAREHLEALSDVVSSRPEEEREPFERQLSAFEDRIAALDERAAELQELEQMDWERAHDSLRADVRGLQNDLRTLEARLR